MTSKTEAARAALSHLADCLRVINGADDDRVLAEEKVARLLARADLNDWDTQFRALNFLSSLVVLVENWHETYTPHGGAAQWAELVD